MAEIKIKKKAPIWPWIIGILVLLAIIYFVFVNNDRDDVDNAAITNTEQVTEDQNMDNTVDNTVDNDMENNDVSDYTTYVSDQNMDVSHEYSSSALNKLIAATRETADNLNVDVNADLSEAQNKADEITNDPESLNHANKIKDAGQTITRALKKIQTEKFPDLQSQYNEVETAVSDIKTDTPTLDQKDAVRGFFNKAGNLLTSIQNNHGQAQ